MATPVKAREQLPRAVRYVNPAGGILEVLDAVHALGHPPGGSPPQPRSS